MNDLIENIDRLHTTEMGVERIKRNLSLEVEDVAMQTTAVYSCVRILAETDGSL